MELIKNFSRLFVVLSLFLQFVHAEDDELSQLIATTSNLVDQLEYEVISEQTLFENNVSETLNKTRSTRNLLKGNGNFKKMIASLNNIVNILTNLNGTSDFTLSSFSKSNLTGCSGISRMTMRLEGQIDHCITAIKASQTCIKSLSPQTGNLKIEYSVNYIHLNKTTVRCVLKSISILDKLVDVTTEFSSHLYSAAKQIAGILYDIKVQKYKTCGVSKNQNVEFAAMKYLKATTKAIEIKSSKARKATKKTTMSVADYGL